MEVSPEGAARKIGARATGDGNGQTATNNRKEQGKASKETVVTIPGRPRTGIITHTSVPYGVGCLSAEYGPADQASSIALK